MAVLEDGKCVRTMDFSEDQKAFVDSLNLLTSKPVIYATNVSEDDLADEGENNAYVAKVREFAATENAEVVVVCDQIEAEIAELDTEEEKKELQKNQVVVPDIRNLAIEDAVKILEESNLKANLDPDIEIPEGSKVVDMFPKPGVKVDENSSIMLYFNN